VTIKDMHYDFKQKLNKLDSQQYRNLRIPEIDWKLNEAQELFVKMVAKPRSNNLLGFETSQRTIDDIRELVCEHTAPINNDLVSLPADYWYFLGAKSLMKKGICKDFPGTIKIRQHDDEFESSPFDNSSFEWREVNGLFTKDGLKLHTDGTFENVTVVMDYIKKLNYIHNAEDFRAGGYNLPSGISLTGSEDCILPEGTHREIVDLAVLVTTGDLQIQDQFKTAKVNLNIPLQ